MSPSAQEMTSAGVSADLPGAHAKRSRKPHRKSRSGCRRCKERRVKCNEEKPTCFNCKRQGTSCVYPDINLTTAHRHDAISPSNPGTPGYGACASGVFFDMKDLALLHHWSTSTTITLSAATWTHHVWTIVVPRIAFQHSYLMHGILAIAALHMAYLTPTSSRDLHIDAAGHYDEAIRGFREAMADINERNCDAMFATSIIIMFYIFAVTSRDDVVSAPKPPPRDLEVLDAKWISMVRGCGAVLSPAYEYVSRGPLKAFLEIGDWEILDPDKNPNEDDERLVALKNIWDSDYGDVNRKEAYSKTLYCLRQTLQWMGDHAMSDSRIYWAGPFIWLHIIPDAYLELLWQRQPPALILFAYFGALVHQLDGFWWAEGWGRKIVGAVDESLGPYWRPRIEWPIQVVGLHRDGM